MVAIAQSQKVILVQTEPMKMEQVLVCKKTVPLRQEIVFLIATVPSIVEVLCTLMMDRMQISLIAPLVKIQQAVEV